MQDEVKVKELAKVLNNDPELLLFFSEWWKAGRNSTRAYQALHPEYNLEDPNDYAVCATLGSRLFKKVDIFAVLTMYGLGPERYFKELAEGLEAVKSDMTGQILPDHTARKAYHDKLGKLLGLEKGDSGVNVQVNNFMSLNDFFSRIDKRVAEDGPSTTIS